MKKIITLLAAVLLLASCEDYLNVKPRGRDVASKVEHYQGLIYGPERFLLREVFPYMCFETYTDAAGYEMIYSDLGSFATNAYKWEADIFREDEQCSEWNGFTTILYNCNKIINEVMDAEDGTHEQKLALQAEARMMRAWCTFMMHEFFGNVPIITVATTVDAEFPLKSEEQVVEFVLGEMREALPALPDAPEHNLRIFKASGYGLYGKVLFMLGRYGEAGEQFGTAFESLQASSPLVKLLDLNGLVDENKDMSYPVDAENPERLFCFSGMPHLFDAIYGGMYNQLFFGVKNELLEKYFADRADTRLTAFASVSTGKSAYASYQKKQQYSANLNSARLVTNYGLDLSELYTMFAECLAREGKTSEASALLLELRRHRMEPGHEALPAEISTADQLVVYAFEERMREQLGFGTSWFDMKRLWDDPLFQDLKGYYVHTVGDEVYTLVKERLTMKIPPSVIAWHPEYNVQ